MSLFWFVCIIIPKILITLNTASSVIAVSVVGSVLTTPQTFSVKKNRIFSVVFKLFYLIELQNYSVNCFHCTRVPLSLPAAMLMQYSMLTILFMQFPSSHLCQSVWLTSNVCRQVYMQVPFTKRNNHSLVSESSWQEEMGGAAVVSEAAGCLEDKETQQRQSQSGKHSGTGRNNN